MAVQTPSASPVPRPSRRRTTPRTSPSTPSAWADVVAFAPAAIAGFDRELRCIGANPRFHDLSRQALGQAVGVPLVTLLPELTGPDLALVQRILDGGSSGASTTVRVGNGPRQELWVLHLYPLTPDDDVTGLGLLAEDVTGDLPELEPELVTAVADSSEDDVQPDGRTPMQQAVDDALELADPILDRACGLVMGRQGCTEGRALLLMARIARRTHRTLQQVALDLYMAANRPAAGRPDSH